MVYLRPQVRVFQQFTSAAAIGDNVRRAYIVGPNALLHRYSVPGEKATIGLGAYDAVTAATASWPGKQGGSIVDLASAKLFVENGLLKYFENRIGQTTGDLGTTTPVAGKANWITHSDMRWKTGGGMSRSTLLGDRDVAIGDVVHIRGVEDPLGDCIEHNLWTTVAGFASNQLASVVGTAYSDVSNPGTSTFSFGINFTAGPVNCVQALLADNTYTPLASGQVDETYTIRVIKSSVSGCQSARLRVTSASGTDDVSEVTPSAFGSPTAIGTRGLSVTFSVASGGGCEVEAANAGVIADNFVVGQVWTLTVQADHVEACATAAGTYTGPFDDTYIVEVTKGGTFGQLPKVTVSTARGLDASGPTTVTGAAVSIPIGSYGVTMSFDKCGVLSDPITGLRKGDKFYVDVVSSASGPITTLILRDNLPTALLAADDLDIQLFIPKSFEITKNRLGSAPLTNYAINSSQITINSGITAYDSEWTVNGVQLPLPLESGATGASGTQYGQLYMEYREWVPDASAELRIATSAADLDDIPGQLDPANPLKWGVFKALTNTSAAGVAYTSITDPSNIDTWQNALNVAEGRSEFYNFVPMSHDTAVQGLFVAQALAESAPEAANWKGVILNAPYAETKRLVGNTTTLAVVADNPNVSGTQYTLMTIPTATLLTSGVKPGDSVRFMYTADGFGGDTYSTYTVDSVLSETTLILSSGTPAAISVPQRVEVWHNMTKSEIVADLVAKAQGYASSRVVMVAPDIVYEGGVATPGYFAAAALGGLISSVLPNQGLTQVNVQGLSGIAARTRDYFKASLLDQLSAGGVWTITADRAGNIFSRHAVTTDTTDLKHREEMIRRNADSISYDFAALLKPYVGRTNATQTVLDKLEYEIERLLGTYITQVLDQNLGPRLIAGEIAKDNLGNKLLRIHPLAADRIEIFLTVTFPAPANNLDLHIVG